ncbi:MAG: hypothetical protein H6711_22880 [Myxococcales bacterium]|nr:hypothetical protein [Myxococcales bacterium]
MTESDGASESDGGAGGSAGLDSELVPRGCVCGVDERPAAPLALLLALPLLAGPRRRRSHRRS